MNILGTLSVFPHIPERIQRLHELADNLWWSWNPDAQALYATLNVSLWDSLCLLYTSDAADDLLCVDLGGRRILKKKTLRTYASSYLTT